LNLRAALQKSRTSDRNQVRALVVDVIAVTARPYETCLFLRGLEVFAPASVGSGALGSVLLSPLMELAKWPISNTLLDLPRLLSPFPLRILGVGSGCGSIQLSGDPSGFDRQPTTAFLSLENHYG
jgi:hypothetical protein